MKLKRGKKFRKARRKNIILFWQYESAKCVGQQNGNEQSCELRARVFEKEVFVSLNTLHLNNIFRVNS